MPDITYIGKSEAGYFDLFHLLADDQSEACDGSERRPVLEILVSPDNKIWVAAIVGSYGVLVPQETNGVVHRHTDEQLEVAGVDTSIICLGAVASYVVPRIATLMARVYCPRVNADQDIT